MTTEGTTKWWWACVHATDGLVLIRDAKQADVDRLIGQPNIVSSMLEPFEAEDEEDAYAYAALYFMAIHTPPQ